MSPALVVLIGSTAAGVMAAILLVAHERAAPRGAEASVAPFRGDGPTRWAGAVVAGSVVFASSGWLLPSAVVAVGSWLAVARWQRRDRRSETDVERTDALASWIENLRDVLIAGDQPVGAITATVSTCGPSIRPAVRRLAAGLGRQDPETVMRRFADDIDDPLGDLVAAGLLIAVLRGARTVTVLDSLADQARHQADRRRLVEAERAPIQREVNVLSVVMGGLVVGLLAFGRAEYLHAYDTPSGQLFLGVVLTAYAALLLRVQRLARYPRPGRFLTGDGSAPRSDSIGAR